MDLDETLSGTATTSPVRPGPSSAEERLRSLYGAYRQRQAAALLSLLPRDAVRPLYRRAREWAAAHGLHRPGDPMASLLGYCESLLPLPPFQEWVADFRANRAAYLEELARDGAPLAGRDDPVTVEMRAVVHDGGRWLAGLSLFRDGDVWRGFIRFEEEVGERSFRTADVFRETRAGEIRDRFLSFAEDTLRAFLRSTLP